jgi:DNA-binding MarR family transcriptional regulator
MATSVISSSMHPGPRPTLDTFCVLCTLCIVHSYETAASAQGGVRSFRAGLRRLEREIARRLGAETSCCGVSLAQCHCLLEVEEHGEPTVGDLAAALDVDGSTMSRNLDGMAAASLVERSPNPRDRRSVLVRLSKAGRRKAGEINGANDRFYGEILGRMSPEERKCVTRGIELLGRRMRELREERGG